MASGIIEYKPNIKFAGTNVQSMLFNKASDSRVLIQWFTTPNHTQAEGSMSLDFNASGSTPKISLSKFTNGSWVEVKSISW